MSKKYKKKHYNEIKSSQVIATAAPAPQAVQSKDSTVYAAHKQEYKDISSDLIKVLVVNGLFLVGVLILYYINKSNPFLENWYNALF